MNEYKLSKYIRIFDDIAEDVILYNTRNRAIIGIPVEFQEGRELNDIVSDDELKELKDLGFFDSDFVEEETIYDSFSSLIISVETMLACNLACPYCYQIGKKTQSLLSEESINCLCSYIEKIWHKAKYKNLVLKVLGGEPALFWNKAESVINGCKKFCDLNSISLQLMIDTNGTIIKDYFKLKDFSSVLFTIPITHKFCHNKVRVHSDGHGTYDDILSNLEILKKELPNSDIIVRYNVDAENILLFRDFVKDIKNKISFAPILSPNYTMNLGEGGFKNRLSYHDFVEWLSTDCIDILLENDLPITISPFSLKQKCQCWSPYSLKLFSDGTVGACAMSFFDNERPTIQTLLNEGYMGRKWEEQKAYSVFDDNKCTKCLSLFLCGGAYHQPCMKSLTLLECNNADRLHLNLKEFLRRYLLAIDCEKEHLFVGFNTYGIYK